MDGIVERDFLRRDRVFSRVNWDTQRSGIEIVPEIAVELERVWADTTLENDFILPDEIGDEIFEGAQRSVLVNAYERNPRARRKCIEHFGNRCAVCDFDFDKTYGKNVARGYIHVHHLTPLAEIGEEYVVNPI